jgi:predicted pyridoxine 5'-phosphate oxidase superfamily flavin-nucleotide-binding protein
MSRLPETIIEAWKSRKGPIILATVDGEGRPNIIYATCVSMYDEESVVVADNYFDKTKANIREGSRGAVLFMTEEEKAFQLKGDIEYHTGGPVFEDMLL